MMLKIKRKNGQIARSILVVFIVLVYIFVVIYYAPKEDFFAIVAVAFLAFVLNLAKSEHVIISQRCMESATRCGMELTRSVACNQDAGRIHLW